MSAAGGTRFRFAFSLDGQNWRELAPGISGDDLPPWDLATRIALTAGGAPGAAARFDYFRIRYH